MKSETFFTYVSENKASGCSLTADYRMRVDRVK